MAGVVERKAPAVGLLLAAGEGRRMGRPKALVRDPDGTSWLLRAVRALAEGGCSPVVVVLGAEADLARALLDGHDLDVLVVEATAWSTGMAASLRVGLEAAASTAADTAVVTLVDLPDVDATVLQRAAPPLHWREPHTREYPATP